MANFIYSIKEWIIFIACVWYMLSEKRVRAYGTNAQVERDISGKK